MPGSTNAVWRCPHCGYAEVSNDDPAPKDFFRPWHIRGRRAVKEYVESLGEEAHEWLLALYVDEHFQLLAVDTVGRGDVASVKIPTWRLINHGQLLKAYGFVLVHNHPSGDARASRSDIRATVNLARIAHDLDMPLLDHLIVAGDDLKAIGGW